MEEQKSAQTKMEEQKTTQTKIDEKNTAESKVAKKDTLSHILWALFWVLAIMGIAFFGPNDTGIGTITSIESWKDLPIVNIVFLSIIVIFTFYFPKIQWFSDSLKNSKGLEKIILTILGLLFLSTISYLIDYTFAKDNITVQNGLALFFLWILIICYNLHILLLSPILSKSWQKFRNTIPKISSTNNDDLSPDRKKILTFGYLLLSFVIPVVFSLRTSIL